MGMTMHFKEDEVSHLIYNLKEVMGSRRFNDEQLISLYTIMDILYVIRSQEVSKFRNDGDSNEE